MPRICARAGDLVLGEVEQPVPLEDVHSRRHRVLAPASLSDICAADEHERATHALGKSYSDVVHGFRGRSSTPPTSSPIPRDETDLERLLEWCAAERLAAIPYGGGTSVVGGVTPDVPGATTAPSRSTSAPWTACSRSTPSRARP